MSGLTGFSCATMMPPLNFIGLMEQIALPSLVHYELLLQLLERETLPSVDHNPALREQVQRMIISLRKAMAQQRQLELICEQSDIAYEHRWSLNSVSAIPESATAAPMDTDSVAPIS